MHDLQKWQGDNLYIQRERPIGAIYKGSKLVWQAIRSCFGKGFWNNEKPWNNEEGWKNN